MRLELFHRYLRGCRFDALIRDAFRGVSVGGDVGIVAMVRVLISLLVVGGRPPHDSDVTLHPVHRAALLLAPSGRLTLRLTNDPATRRLDTNLEHALAHAA